MASDALFTETEHNAISEFLNQFANDVIASDQALVSGQTPIYQGTDATNAQPWSSTDMNLISNQPSKSGKKPTKRRKSNARATSPSQGTSRERLTEEEKKANHIASEQKRRANIRNGFDQLIALVPELRDCTSRSEANVLQKTCDYLRAILIKSETLREQLKSIALNGVVDAEFSSDSEASGSDVDDDEDSKSKRIRTYRRSQYGPYVPPATQEFAGDHKS